MNKMFIKKFPKKIQIIMEDVFEKTYEEREKKVGKNAFYSAKAAAMSVAYKELSRNITDRGR
jgi:hypothetical protein